MNKQKKYMNLQLFAKEREGEPDKETEAKPEETEVEKSEPTLEEILAKKDKEWQSEVDRRVNQARTKWEKELEEKERLAKLSEEEKIEELKRIKEEELAEREKELNIKTAKLNIMEKLGEVDLLDVADIFKAENYIGENIKNLDKDIELLQDFINLKVEKEVEEMKEKILRVGDIPGKTGNPVIPDKKKPKSLADIIAMQIQK